MAAYYSEWDPYAAQWLRNLIKAGHIADGEVDERSIKDVSPSDVRKFIQCHWFAGIGVWSHALRLADWSDDRPVWTGSCPCQPFSAAGKQAGVDDERHLWPIWNELINECRPPVIFGEQVAAAIGHHWIDTLSSDLETQGYATGAAVLGAHSVGAPHLRQRLYFVANTERNQQPRQEPRGRTLGRMGRVEQPFPWNEHWQSSLSRFRVMGDGNPRNVAATDAARNAIVPQVAAEVIAAFMECKP